jgi:hypothetical protein
MSVDWKKLDDLILQVVSASASEQIAEEEFEQGRNVSEYPQLKVMFDGFGDDGDDESMASFALFVHKNSAENGFVFPEHEETAWAIVQRPDEEAIIYCWYNREEDDWEVLEPETENEDDLSAEKLIDILSKVVA